jgi:hypothetical protein
MQFLQSFREFLSLKSRSEIYLFAGSSTVGVFGKMSGSVSKEMLTVSFLLLRSIAECILIMAKICSLPNPFGYLNLFVLIPAVNQYITNLLTNIIANFDSHLKK